MIIYYLGLSKMWTLKILQQSYPSKHYLKNIFEVTISIINTNDFFKTS